MPKIISNAELVKAIPSKFALALVDGQLKIVEATTTKQASEFLHANIRSGKIQVLGLCSPATTTKKKATKDEDKPNDPF